MEENWFLHFDGIVHGPFTTSMVSKTVTTKSYMPDTLVWKKGMADWVPISYWAKLQDLPAYTVEENQELAAHLR